jgi:hypothetical protein
MCCKGRRRRSKSELTIPKRAWKKDKEKSISIAGSAASAGYHAKRKTKLRIDIHHIQEGTVHGHKPAGQDEGG